MSTLRASKWLGIVMFKPSTLLRSSRKIPNGNFLTSHVIEITRHLKTSINISRWKSLSRSALAEPQSQWVISLLNEKYSRIQFQYFKIAKSNGNCMQRYILAFTVLKIHWSRCHVSIASRTCVKLTSIALRDLECHMVKRFDSFSSSEF